MINKIKNETNMNIGLSSISVFLLLLYSNMTSLSKYIYLDSSVIVAGTLFLAVLIMYIIGKNKISGAGLRVFNAEIYWLLTLIIMLIFNQDFKYGDTGIFIQYSLLVLFMILSKFSKNWIYSFQKFMIFFAIIHSICSILFFIVPGLYSNYIIKLFDAKFQDQLMNWYNEGYATGLTTHYSQNGVYLAIATGVAFCVLICNKNKKIKHTCFLITSTIALLLTGKRGPLMFCIVAILVVYFTFLSNKPLSRWLKMGMVLVIGLILGVILVDYIPSIANTLSRFTTYGTDITNGRIELYEFAWKWFKENPILGIGWGGYSHRINTTFIGAIYGRDSNMYAHNVYLQLLCDVGIVGFMIFIIPMILTIKKTYKLLKLSRKRKIMLNTDEECILSISFFMQLFFLMYCFTGNPLYDYMTLFPYMLSCAAIFTIAYQKKQDIKKY